MDASSGTGSRGSQRSSALRPRPRRGRSSLMTGEGVRGSRRRATGPVITATTWTTTTRISHTIRMTVVAASSTQRHLLRPLVDKAGAMTGTTMPGNVTSGTMMHGATTGGTAMTGMTMTGGTSMAVRGTMLGTRTSATMAGKMIGMGRASRTRGSNRASRGLGYRKARRGRCTGVGRRQQRCIGLGKVILGQAGTAAVGCTDRRN